MSKLYVITPPEFSDKFPRWKYSDDLFNWFYSRVKYTGFSLYEFEPFDINIDATKRDNQANGIRIWSKNGGYEKLDEIYFLMEFTDKELLRIWSLNQYPTIDDVIGSFYLK